MYDIPPSSTAKLEYRDLPLDAISWMHRRLGAKPNGLHTAEDGLLRTPLTPLHRGHGLLCTSGLLNGVFGSGADRHVAYWESVKENVINYTR
ncbi:MAG TPA: hypothetical protein VFL57_14480 [Bryobacteraceae bacterium]|nr:hypothetical protein [Bryobacteraceae bacterium]